MTYAKPKSEAYMARKAMLAKRRARQSLGGSAYDPQQVAAFAAYSKAIRKRNGVGRPSFEKRGAATGME